MIRLTYDPSVDALMIELVPGATSAKTVRITDSVRADLDREGRVIGFEILEAALQLGREAVEHLPTGSELLTLEEAAAESGRAAGTLRVQLNAGRLKGVKRGRDWYVDATDLLNYVENLSPRGRRPAESPAAKKKARGVKKAAPGAAARARKASNAR